VYTAEAPAGGQGRGERARCGRGGCGGVYDGGERGVEWGTWFFLLVSSW
jgi:hypothetical protein